MNLSGIWTLNFSLLFNWIASVEAPVFFQLTVFDHFMRWNKCNDGISSLIKWDNFLFVHQRMDGEKKNKLNKISSIQSSACLSTKCNDNDTTYKIMPFLWTRTANKVIFTSTYINTINTCKQRWKRCCDTQSGVCSSDFLANN